MVTIRYQCRGRETSLPLDRDPLNRDPLDRYPLDRDPARRNMGPGTENPQKEHGTRQQTRSDIIQRWYLLTEKLTGSRMKLVRIPGNRSK